METGHTVADVGLDLDEVTCHPDQGDAVCAGDGHYATPRVWRTIQDSPGEVFGGI
jgi:hypothetical protein